MKSYGGHDFSANTNYQLIYIKRILYNIPIGENSLSVKWICTRQDYLNELDMSML